jgi:hypothetical protein
MIARVIAKWLKSDCKAMANQLQSNNKAITKQLQSNNKATNFVEVHTRNNLHAQRSNVIQTTTQHLQSDKKALSNRYSQSNVK